MKTKRIIFFIITSLVAFGLANSYAETIYTKDGRTITTKIINKIRNTIWYEVQLGSGTARLGIDIDSISKILNDDGTISPYSPTGYVALSEPEEELPGHGKDRSEELDEFIEIEEEPFEEIEQPTWAEEALEVEGLSEEEFGEIEVTDEEAKSISYAEEEPEAEVLAEEGFEKAEQLAGVEETPEAEELPEEEIRKQEVTVAKFLGLPYGEEEPEKAEISESAEPFSITRDERGQEQVQKPVPEVFVEEVSKIAVRKARPKLKGLFFGTFLILLIPALALYIYISICLQTIAKKTGTSNTWRAWLPIINLFLMVSIAKRPQFWMYIIGGLLLLIWIPIVNFIVLLGMTALMIILWCDIAKARNKPFWLGILMLVPLVQIVIPGYIAFSD